MTEREAMIREVIDAVSKDEQARELVVFFLTENLSGTSFTTEAGRKTLLQKIQNTKPHLYDRVSRALSSFAADHPDTSPNAN